MKCKSGFTIIEMLIVIMIVGTLMLMLKNIFIPQNKDIIYAKSCTNNIYGKINNYINSAITSKGLFTGGIKVFPNQYTIKFSPDKNTIQLGYINESINKNYDTLDLSGAFAKSIYCQTNSYQVIISGLIQNIQINKGLQSPSNKPIFQLQTNGIQNFTGNIDIAMCNLDKTNCKVFAKYIIDTRTKHISYIKCMTFTGSNSNECRKRNQ